LKTVLFQDDFKQFPIGEFPYDKNHSAMGEYNYVVNEGFYGDWVDMVCNHTYNGSGASWIITEDEGKYFMEQMRLIDNRPHKTHPMLMTGSVQWNNYTVSVHAVKTNAYNIGAKLLGDQCLELEQAGKKIRNGEEIAEHEAFIREKHPSVLRLYKETVKESEAYLNS